MVSFDKTVSGSATTPGLQWRDTGANIATVVYDVASSTVQLKHGTTNAFSVGAAETTSTDPIRYTALTIGNIDTAGNDKTLRKRVVIVVVLFARDQ